MIVKLNGNVILAPCPAPDLPTRAGLSFEWLKDFRLSNLKNVKEVFQVIRDPMVTLQIIPDRTVFASGRNHLDDLGRALHELYFLPHKRFQFRKWQITYRPQENITFDITFEKDFVRFWLSVPKRWESYAKNKLQTVWPKATVKAGEIPSIDPQRALCSILSLKNHNLYSLAVSKNDLKPLNSLLEVSKDIQKGDYARIQIVAVPRDRQTWEYEAQRAAKKHRMGQLLMRNDLSAGNFFDNLLKLLDNLFSVVFEVIGGVADQDKTKIDKDPDNILALLVEKNNRELKEATVQKISSPVFNGLIRIAAQSDDEKRASFLVKSLSNAYGDLSAENELKRRDLKRKAASKEINLMNTHRAPAIRLSYSVFSHAELGKLMQVPGAELQDSFKAIEQVPLRESELAKSITDPSGIPLAHAKFHGKEVPVFIPTKNLDRLCLPHCGIGGMGTGKTSGYATNTAYGIYTKGGTAIVFDPGKGQVGDELEKIVPPEHLKRYRIGFDAISLDWRESLHSERGRNRFANALVGYVDVASDEAGAQTIRFLRAAAKAVPNGQLSEIISLFLDKNYRKKLLPQMRPNEQMIWQNFDTLTDARQNQIAMPVLNRLDVITGDDYLMECLEDSNAIGIDFVTEFDVPGQIIVIDMPFKLLGAEIVDVVGSLLTSKIQLAVQLRQKDHPVFVIQDEPHQYMRGYKTWKNLAVISRKYRVGFHWLFHSWEQIPRDLAVIIKSALPHYHIWTSSKETYKALAEEIAPFGIDEGMATPFHYAINVIRDEGGTVTPFLAKMLPPPSMNKKIRKQVAK